MQLWFPLVDDHDDMDGVLQLAAELLPLADLATGPGLDWGLGSNRPEFVLDVIVSRLDAHPGKGWRSSERPCPTRLSATATWP
jgi:hypothetical protein